MKKGLKITLIILGIILTLITLDTLQAKILNNSPIIKIRKNLDGGNTDYIDLGLLVNHYHCNNEEKITTWKKTKYACPTNIKKKEDEIMENITNINITINGKKYIGKLENNETSKALINLLPQEFKMQELNGNEKYIYISKTLPTNETNPKHIQTGDIMLYGNNCLVIFYKSFDTNYNYTKIGHIDNLPELDSSDITIKFEK